MTNIKYGLKIIFGLVFFTACSPESKNGEEENTDKPTTEISITGSTTVNVGEQIALTAIVKPEDSTESITWSCSNENATISGENNTAIVTGVAKGDVIVTASSGNQSATHSITVTEVESTDESEIDFEDYSASTYLLKVRNNTSKRLIAFKGIPSETTLIGGIPASTSNHGLPRDSKLFSKTEDFLLFIITEEEYDKNKESLSSLINYPFARLYAYYNVNSVNNIVYEISSVMGGDGKIIVQNNTDYNIELRKDGIHGETIGYTAARTLNTTFYVDVGDYFVFPVFRKFDTTLNEIVTVYPKDSDGDPLFKNHQITSSDSLNIDATQFSSGVTFTNGYAYVTVVNSSSDGIQLYDGANSLALTTSTGGKIINSGKSLTFAVAMEKLSSNSGTGEFRWADNKKYSQYRVGSPMGYDYSKYLSGDENTLFTYEAGKNYIFTVAGTNYKNLTVTLTNTNDIEF